MVKHILLELSLMGLDATWFATASVCILMISQINIYSQSE